MVGFLRDQKSNKSQYPTEAYKRKLIQAQYEMRDQLSVVLVQSVECKLAFSYKISRQEAKIIKERMERNLPTLAVVPLRGRFYIQPILRVIEEPTTNDLSYAMRWVHQTLSTHQFGGLIDIEERLVKENRNHG